MCKYICKEYTCNKSCSTCNLICTALQYKLVWSNKPLKNVSQESIGSIGTIGSIGSSITSNSNDDDDNAQCAIWEPILGRYGKLNQYILHLTLRDWICHSGENRLCDVFGIRILGTFINFTDLSKLRVNNKSWNKFLCLKIAKLQPRTCTINCNCEY